MLTGNLSTYLQLKFEFDTFLQKDMEHTSNKSEDEFDR